MRALDIAEKYFFEVGLVKLREELPEVLPCLASGIAGRGSECFGYDDEISRDHDFASGFALYLTREDERKYGFKLERFYSRLLKEFPPENYHTASSNFGSAERGVIIIEDFFERHLGFPGAPQNFRQWLYTPEYAFAEAVNGKVFYDNCGVYSSIRQAVLNDMPEDVRIKKLAARAVAMAQSGQYNFMRCIKHNEPGAAMLALNEFVSNAVSMIFLLNKRFAPYYKWSFRAMRELPRLAELAESLEELLLRETPPEVKAQQVESIAQAVINELTLQELSSSSSDYLEAHAMELMKHIRNREIAALHIMEG